MKKSQFNLGQMKLFHFVNISGIQKIFCCIVLYSFRITILVYSEKIRKIQLRNTQYLITKFSKLYLYII